MLGRVSEVVEKIQVLLLKLFAFIFIGRVEKILVGKNFSVLVKDLLIVDFKVSVSLQEVID